MDFLGLLWQMTVMYKLGLNKFLLVFFLSIVIFLSAFDLIQDFKSSASLGHLISEAIVLILSIAIFLKVTLSTISFKNKTIQLGESLKVSQEETLHWKAKNEEILKGFSQIIKDQFNVWKLTEAEKDVGLLLLKGFSLKEIADLRKVSERTVRQQAIEIYKKSNLNGRAEFAAFFLDDLMISNL